MALSNSPRLNFLLAKMGIFNYFQVLEHLPRRYESFLYTSPEELKHLQDKQKIVLFGKVIGPVKTLRFSKFLNSKFFFRDASGTDYMVVAWNRSYLGNMLNNEDDFTLQASYDAKKHELNLLTIKKGRISEEKALQPVYSLPSEYPTYSWTQLVQRALKECEGKIYNHIPRLFVEKYRFISRYDALKKCHQPTGPEDIHQGQRVLKYEEALKFSLKNQIIRGENKALVKDRRRQIEKDKLEAFIKGLPYALTSDQRQVVDECVADMDKLSLMYRLLQGDVGTGKTLVAAILMYANHLRSAQSALMAPTDALARQHYETLKKIYAGTKIQVDLLVGGMEASDRHAVLEDLGDGTTDIIVGTHALFSKDVAYAYLGLAVIDEQHKFGVNQRYLLASKGEHADVLLMSATPIPRTLSLTLYGDLDVSSLTEFPGGKRDIKTAIVKPSAKEIDRDIEASLASNHRVYIVAPQIEEGEEASTSSVKSVYKDFASRYPGKVAILHGKMSAEDKEAALLAFRSGLCPILVSTSVIEVGIDVREADLMLIYDPSHFALSSLHQLRGRIGRSGEKATCLLVYDDNDPDELDKLKVLVESNDGFHIAEEDLRRRGPGQLAGTRQSGLPDFQFVNLIDDFKMFEYARDDAAYILAHSDEKQFAYIIGEANKETSGVSMA
jgi:ATP-dependent DNA helicase RecG